MSTYVRVCVEMYSTIINVCSTRGGLFICVAASLVVVLSCPL